MTEVEARGDALIEALEDHGDGPPYGYLSDADLKALAAYLTARR